jgi:hypothetical protein
MKFTGKFETHLTVHLETPSEMTRLKQWSTDHHVKFLHIILDRGSSRSQPMLTHHGEGNLASALSMATHFCHHLKHDNFSVSRIKIEVTPENEDVPQSRIEALQHPDDRYFEHHIKVLLNAEMDVQILRAIVEPHSAHLSYNACKVRPDQRQERFITQRCLRMGRDEATQRLQWLVQAIERLDYSILKVEREFVVYDNNLALDQDWTSQSIGNSGSAGFSN